VKSQAAFFEIDKIMIQSYDNIIDSGRCTISIYEKIIML